MDKCTQIINRILSNCFGSNYEAMSGIEIVCYSLIWLGLIFLAFLIIMLSVRTHLAQKAEREMSSIRERFQDYLSHVVTGQAGDQYMHSHNSVDPIYLNTKDLQSEKYRKVFLCELMSLHKLIDGDAKERLRDLYLGLGFASEVKHMIFSKNWEDRIEAIQQISRFQLNQFYPILVTSLHDKNRYVRQAAFVQYAALKSNPIDALKYVDGKMNGWEKQVILENLRKRSVHLLPIFKNYIAKYSEHSDFLNELSIMYNQEDRGLVYLSHINVLKA